jgi:hypothetical protein
VSPVAQLVERPELDSAARHPVRFEATVEGLRLQFDPARRPEDGRVGFDFETLMIASPLGGSAANQPAVSHSQLG